ncbi:MAG: response regulator [Proteobacteria bacterium]|nr:response regulator [Pseudomonadota bacterium]
MTDPSFGVLIVDDSGFMRRLLRKSLMRLGVDHIVEAVDGKDALDAMMEHSVDLIISDLDMPKVNGLELLRAVVGHSTLKRIPFMVLTPDISNKMFNEAMKTGAAEFVVTPFTPEEIAAKINSIRKKSS